MSISSDKGFARSGNGLKVSPYLQNLLLATCAESPYSLSRELLKLYLGIDISEMQLYRLTDHYGAALSAQPQAGATALLHPLEKKEDGGVYAMADGSMVLTREEQWKEAKPGRIFRGQDCLPNRDKAGTITRSQYLSHFGDSHAFTQQMEGVPDEYGSLGKRLIFIKDGAVWLRNRIADAVSIPDFYDAKEYLCDFARECFEQEPERKRWGIEQQADLLLQSGIAQVIERAQALGAKRKTPAAQKLITCYTQNSHPMQNEVVGAAVEQKRSCQHALSQNH